MVRKYKENSFEIEEYISIRMTPLSELGQYRDLSFGE